MLEFGIVIFIVLIILYIVFFGGLSKDDTVPVSATGPTLGSSDADSSPDTMSVNGKKCEIIKINANGHCGYIAIMYKLEKLQNETFKKIFKEKLNKKYINGLLSYDTKDVELFYNNIIDETLKLVITNEDIEYLKDKKIKEINDYQLNAISNKFKVNIHIHKDKTKPIIIKQINNEERNGDIHLLKTGEINSGHYDLLDC